MVANEIVLPCDRDTAWELLTDPDARREWLGDWADRETLVEDAEPGERLAFWWPEERVEILLTDVPGGTRVSVFSAPVGPMALAAA
jgi:uncharacterized protein YndB with AHSA1/START domain